MQIDLEKLSIAQAKSGKDLNELGLSKETLYRVRKGHSVRPKTVHKFATALGCEVTDIIKVGDAE